MLTVHVVISVGWIGIEAGLLALGLIGLYTRDPEVPRAAYVAIGLFGGIFIVPVSIGALVTGVLLSVGTPWGLLRHYWVLVKFVLTVALTAGGILVLNQRLQEAAIRVSGIPANVLMSADVGTLRFRGSPARGHKEGCVEVRLIPSRRVASQGNGRYIEQARGWRTNHTARRCKLLARIKRK